MKILSNKKYEDIMEKIADLKKALNTCDRDVRTALAKASKYEEEYDKEHLKNIQLEFENKELHEQVKSLLKEKKIKQIEGKIVDRNGETTIPKKRGRKPKNAK